VRLRVGSRSVRYGNRSPNTGTRAVEAAVAGGAQRQAVRRRSEVVLVPRPRVEVGGVRRLAASEAGKPTTVTVGETYVAPCHD